MLIYVCVCVCIIAKATNADAYFLCYFIRRKKNHLCSHCSCLLIRHFSHKWQQLRNSQLHTHTHKLQTRFKFNFHTSNALFLSTKTVNLIESKEKKMCGLATHVRFSYILPKKKIALYEQCEFFCFVCNLPSLFNLIRWESKLLSVMRVIFHALCLSKDTLQAYFFCVRS